MKPIACMLAAVGCAAGLTVLAGDSVRPAAAAAKDPAVLAAATLPPDAPPPPKGYANRALVMAAIALKQVKVISTETNVPPEVEERLNVEYGRVGDRALALDLYRPRKLDRPVPALLFIHGGGWKGGSREIYKLYCVRWASRGYVTATASYRLSGEAPFPAAVQDVKCAVRFLRANAKRFGIDPDRIAALGGSAGGHLSLMLGCSAGVPALEGDGGHAGVSSAVQAVVDLYGPYDLTTPFAQAQDLVHAFFGGRTFAEAGDDYRLASPKFHLKAGAPPMLIIHGTVDEVVPVAQSDALAARLRELRVPFIYDRLEGWPHALDIALPVQQRCDWMISRFLERYLPLPKAE